MKKNRTERAAPEQAAPQENEQAEVVPTLDDLITKYQEIELLIPFGGKKPGEKIQVDSVRAKSMIENGHASEVSASDSQVEAVTTNG